MKKRSLIAVIVLASVLVCAIAFAGCTSIKATEGLVYTLNDDGGSYACSGLGAATDKQIVIAREYDGKPVTAISDGAFASTDVTGVSIPKCVTKIGARAFFDCTKLMRAKTEGATEIGARAFSNCYALVSVDMGDNVTTIGESAFEGCINLPHVYASKSTAGIGARAFYGCEKLKSANLGDSLAAIEAYTFSGCKSLENIVLPIGVMRVGECAFVGCEKLESFTLGSRVTKICAGAFNNCTALKAVSIPASVVEIEPDSFVSCWSLERISVDSGNPAYSGSGNCLIEKRGKTLVLGCKNSVIPTDGSVAEIGEAAFRDRDGIVEMTVPASVVTIGCGAFGNCDDLARVVISDGASTIADYAFADCDELSSVTIPSSVTHIGVGAFGKCAKLAQITFGGTRAQWNAIEKASGWDDGAGEYDVVCEG